MNLGSYYTSTLLFFSAIFYITANETSARARVKIASREGTRHAGGVSERAREKRASATGEEEQQRNSRSPPPLFLLLLSESFRSRLDLAWKENRGVLRVLHERLKAKPGILTVLPFIFTVHSRWGRDSVPKGVPFSRLEVYESVGISRAEV